MTDFRVPLDGDVLKGRGRDHAEADEERVGLLYYIYGRNRGK